MVNSISSSRLYQAGIQPNTNRPNARRAQDDAQWQNVQQQAQQKLEQSIQDAEQRPFTQSVRPDQSSGAVEHALSTQRNRASQAPSSKADAWSHIPFNDIKNVAQRAGFVDVTERDIRQAYVHGESLLADYSV